MPPDSSEPTPAALTADDVRAIPSPDLAAGPRWNPVFALPNLPLPDPATPLDRRGNFAAYDLGYGRLTLGSAYLAIVAPEDARVQEARSRASGLEQLLGAFRDASGAAARPAILVAREDAPASCDLDAVRAFRNALALAVVLRARVGYVVSEYAMSPRWADAFDLYPAQVGTDGRLHFASAAVTVLGGHDGPLVATTAPYLDVRVQPLLADDGLLAPLAAAWRERYEATDPRRDHAGRALFRSLEIAFAAASVPLRNGASVHDHGVLVALWVSALEVLAHVAHGHANEAYVGALLDAAPWSNAMRWVRRADHPVTRTNKKKTWTEQCPPARAALAVLYAARNDFLHGNPVSWDTLVGWGGTPATGAVSVPTGAAVLYRVALQSFLAQHGWTDAGDTAPDDQSDDPFDGVTMFDDMAAERALRVMLLGRDAADAGEP